ncbi:MAG: hypothetical protein WCO02_14160 [Bacteroidota bacterium]
MKTMVMMVCLACMPVSLLIGQGVESFENFPSSSGSYASGSFTGADGSEWSYVQCRGDKAIDLPTPCLGKKRNPLSRIFSGQIHNGCRKIVFSYRQAFSSAVNLNLLINGELIKNVTTAGGYGDTTEVHTTDSLEVNLPGDFQIEFRQADSLNSGQVCVDDLAWTSFEQGVGSERDVPGAGLPALRLVCTGEKQVRVFASGTGHKRLLVFSADGRLIKDSGFLNSPSILDMAGCPEGFYVFILRNRENIILGEARMILK